MRTFWTILQKKAVWQIVLYTIVSNIFFGVSNNAQQNTLSAWLGFKPIQDAVLSVMESAILFLGMYLIRTYFLNASWRLLIIGGTLLQLFFQALYLLIVFDVWRNSYFYMFTDVSQQFVSSLNFLVGVFCIVEVSEPGYEAITYALITTAHNMVSPLSTVLSNQISGLFDLTSKDIKRDDADVRLQYFNCWILCAGINVISLLTLPLLPRQKKEARELLASGETSKGWATVIVTFSAFCLIYATVTNLATLQTSLKCRKILGGKGCPNSDESMVPVVLLISLTLGFCVVSTYLVVFHDKILKMFGRTAKE